MSGYYLTNAHNWLRDAGLTVIEYGGWKTRARGSGGYASPDRPWCVMWHHTASSWPPDQDAWYCAEGDEDAPLSNVFIARDGDVWLLAAGCTNTNGKGYAIDVSKGTIPNDSMNSYAFGVEMGNNGVGEPWPQVQIDAAFIVSNTINRKLGNLPTDVSTHEYWAPDRKVDPATAAAVQGPWRPHSCTPAGTWDVKDLRSECKRRAETKAPTERPNPMFIAKTNDNPPRWVIGDQIWRHALEDEDHAQRKIEDAARTGYPLFDLESGKPVKHANEVNGTGGVNPRLGVVAK